MILVHHTHRHHHGHHSPRALGCG